MLRSKDLIKKICTTCKKEFITDNEKARVCTKCKEATQRRKREANTKNYKSLKLERRKSVTAKYSIAQISSLMNRYNQKHNTCITYGKFVQMLEDGGISAEDLTI